ncbi:hypothetical protein [Kaistella faecalis]|uniref:hypothetical protein n=1 Tax=Kaistella faecalis TaxID=2852098 RepID=UPI001C4724EF|nr:hypothetical protein [Chryseobacterium faecale]UFK97233.1 hypothetical protein LL667_09695 [Chryseobacterium faecale]
MTDFSVISAYSQHKTRVLVYSSHQPVANFIIYVLNFFEKDFDYFLENGHKKETDSDFVILETSDPQKAKDFKPNIVLIVEDKESEKLSPILKNITGGGVLVYPEKLEEIVNAAENYFRRLPFSYSASKISGEKISISTEMGEIPLGSTDENLVQNMNGIKLLCQQFGIMEEDFYEALMSCE